MVASWATSAVQCAIKSPDVPEAAEVNIAYATEGGSAENGPKVTVAVLEDKEGSPDGADHVMAWRAYPAVVTSVMEAKVEESDGATVTSAKYVDRAVCVARPVAASRAIFAPTVESWPGMAIPTYSFERVDGPYDKCDIDVRCIPCPSQFSWIGRYSSRRMDGH